MLDCPPEQKADTAAFDAVIDVFIEAARGAPTRAALIASLPETLSVRVRQRCFDNGVIPLQGQREALEALALAGAVGATWRCQSARGFESACRRAWRTQDAVYALGERAGKIALADFGLTIPRGKIVAAERRRRRSR